MITCDRDPNKTIKISPELCIRNRSAELNCAMMDQKTGRPQKLRPCLKCPEGIRLFEERKAPSGWKVQPKPQEAEKVSSKSILSNAHKCPECGKNHNRNGICSQCSGARGKRKMIENAFRRISPEPKHVSEPEKPTSTKPLFLLERIDEIPGLMDFLHNKMKSELRETVENQILWELREAMRRSNQ